MPVRSLGFVTDLMIRRIAGSEITDHGDHIVIRTPANPGFWWGNFIVVCEDFANADRWLAAFAAAHPTAEHIAIGLDTDVADVVADYVAAGLEADVSTVMAAARLHEPIVGDGVVCRALSGDQDWAQALDLMTVCNPPENDGERLYLQRKADEWRAQTEAGQGGWYGAFVDGSMRSSLGILTDGSGVSRFQSVETHPESRRQGLARQLIATAAELSIANFAVETLVIVADPDYHASGLYRSLGFVDTDIQVQVSRPPA